jgi:hypothetical protein
MQAASDVLLGWFTTDDADGRRRDYYVRQLWDAKASVAIDLLGVDELARYGEICGWTLARAHARTGDRVAIAAYLGRGDRFDEALATFAEAYADQNERDYEAFAAAVPRADGDAARRAKSTAGQEKPMRPRPASTVGATFDQPEQRG